MFIVAISGTPGTGKTTVSRIVASGIGAKLVSLSCFIIKSGVAEGYDRRMRAHIVDPMKLRKGLRKELSGHGKEQAIVLEGHLSHLMGADVTFVLRLDPPELKRRLEKRGYTKAKVRENVQSEVLDVIYAEALERSTSRRVVVQINVSAMTPQQAAKRILNTLRSKKYKSDKVDWTRKYSRYLS